MKLTVIAITVAAIGVVSCASSSVRTQPAPIESKDLLQATNASPSLPKNSTKPIVSKAADENDPRPATHTVAKGETLYSIALEYGFDYRELANWNQLDDVNLIKIGQTLRLTDPAETRTAMNSNTTELVQTPKVARLPYSEKNLQELNKAGVAVAPQKTALLKTESSSAKAESVQVKLLPAASTVVSQAVTEPTPKATNETEDGDWLWPTQGKPIATFNANSKGIDIAGKLGQAILAADAGKVVYAGNGLRGYGKLIIVKHNKTFLSAYAHNNSILVKEGDTVSRGQKIAEMGNTDSDQVKLHFEIRRFGKPIDPTKYLPMER